MSVFVTLNSTEIRTAKMVELDTRLSIGADSGDTTLITGIREGAKLAVAKALNLFPNFSMPGCDMISTRGNTIRIILVSQKQAVYDVKTPPSEIFVLVFADRATIGSTYRYEIFGYALRENVLMMEGKPAHIYHHVFNLFTETQIFERVIKDQWQVN